MLLTLAMVGWGGTSGVGGTVGKKSESDRVLKGVLRTYFNRLKFRLW